MRRRLEAGSGVPGPLSLLVLPLTRFSLRFSIAVAASGDNGEVPTPSGAFCVLGFRRRKKNIVEYRCC
jgi:hypothetical protein